MQIVVELFAAVVIWIAATAFSALGVDVDQPRAEPKAEKVIPRDPPAPEKSAVRDGCPEVSAPGPIAARA